VTSERPTIKTAHPSDFCLGLITLFSAPGNPVLQSAPLTVPTAAFYSGMASGLRLGERKASRAHAHAQEEPTRGTASCQFHTPWSQGQHILPLPHAWLATARLSSTRDYPSQRAPVLNHSYSPCFTKCRLPTMFTACPRSARSKGARIDHLPAPQQSQLSLHARYSGFRWTHGHEDRLLIRSLLAASTAHHVPVSRRGAVLHEHDAPSRV